MKRIKKIRVERDALADIELTNVRLTESNEVLKDDVWQLQHELAERTETVAGLVAELAALDLTSWRSDLLGWLRARRDQIRLANDVEPESMPYILGVFAEVIQHITYDGAAEPEPIRIGATEQERISNDPQGPLTPAGWLRGIEQVFADVPRTGHSAEDYEESMTHTCHATGCTRAVPPRMFMCRGHWFAVPKTMRDAVWAEYVPGQEIRKDPTPEYLEVTRAAIEYLERDPI